MVEGNAYITIGDPYKDPLPNAFRQPKKEDKAVKPFQIKQAPENEQNGHFSKIVYASSPYNETNLYIKDQPLDTRKKGFGSKDAHRRDEFSNAVRTQQYRESIRKETSLRGDAMDNRVRTLLETYQAEKAAKESTTLTKKQYQYDIGRSLVTEFDPKLSRDSYYKFSPEQDKRFGVSLPVSTDVGDAAWSITYKPPTHGGRSEVKNFLDKSHIKVGSPL